MAIKARDDVTLASITDVSYTRRYYLLQSSTLNPPAAPTVNPAPSPWVTTEPSYTEGSTNSLYTVDLTVFTDASFDYSQVSKSSSYEAAKAAYNKAVAAQSAASAAQTTADGKNKITRSTAVASGAGVAGDQWWQYSGTQIIAMWIHNGTSWVSQTLTDSVITNLDAGTITAGTLNADRIGAASITGAKIAGATVTAANMVAGTITAASGIIADATIGDAQIINGSITNASIKDATIQSAKIANLDAGKITTGYLSADRIAAGSITAAKLVSGTITAASGVIADLAITDAKIANGTISNAKIANLDAGKITTGTLNAARIAANSITADKLNANAFTGQTFTGSVFTAGGGSLPQVLVGPSSGIPGTGDQYGVYISTPSNNAQGSAALSVTPTGPYLQFQDGTNAETFYVDGNGNIRIKNLTDGGMVDLTKLSTQKWVYNKTNTTWIMNFTSTSWTDWSWLTPMLFAVSSPTGRLRVDHGIWFDNIESGDTAWMQYQVGVYTSDPSNNTNVRTDLLNQRAIAPAYSSIGGSGYPTWTAGSEVISVTPNQTYYIRAIYKRKTVVVSRTANIQNYWVNVEPA